MSEGTLRGGYAGFPYYRRLYYTEGLVIIVLI
jgi:hypothetical protein